MAAVERGGDAGYKARSLRLPEGERVHGGVAPPPRERRCARGLRDREGGQDVAERGVAETA